MKLLYKPFALVASLIAGRLGKGIFRALWARLDQADPPDATAPQANLGKVVGAAALEAATMASVAALADRAAARTFEHLTGVWPGREPEEKPGKKEKKRGG
jgi:hypothetical protein